MKKKSLMIYILTALILTAALLVSGGCNGGSDEKKKAGDAESFKVTYATSEDMAAYDVSMDKQIDNIVADETDADALGGWGWVVKQMAWMEAIGQGGYYSAGGLSSINLSYWTVNAFGQLTKADAAVFVPFGGPRRYRSSPSSTRRRFCVKIPPRSWLINLAITLRTPRRPRCISRR